jgi:hypothetical protein
MGARTGSRGGEHPCSDAGAIIVRRTGEIYSRIIGAVGGIQVGETALGLQVPESRQGEKKVQESVPES